MTTTSLAPAAVNRDWLDTAAFAALLAFVGAAQLSIAVAGILLTVVLVAWAAHQIVNRVPFEAPPIFWPLVAYAAATLVSTVFSVQPLTSLFDSRQLLLFLIVPAVYQVARGDRAHLVVTVLLTVGAISATVGVVQYGIFEYDNLGRRPQGALTHYMTYSGTLMLVVGAVAARLLYSPRDRVWSALVMPALLVALALTFTRSAWVGACAALGLLFVLRDRRLLAVVPVLAAVFIALAPDGITDRLYSVFDLNDPTNRDRVAMLRYGTAMVQDDPLTGVGPDMVREVYPDYRDEMAVQPINPHLHNVPMQIAAERGLPALAMWLWFVFVVARDMFVRVTRKRAPALAAAALAAVVAMLTAGIFEYNFGDSEFLMLFLVLVTLPYAAEAEPS